MKGNGDTVRDWVHWHNEYNNPQSPLIKRLEIIQAHVATALSQAPPGPVSLVSLCAGQGHDVIGVLPDHPRLADVTAVLVELDPANADLARMRAARSGLANVDVRVGDAGLVANFADALPADVLLLCGIFGNVPAGDIRRTAAAAGLMCRTGGTVIWTRHRAEPDLTPQVRSWFAEAGFEEIAFETVPSSRLPGVGVGRLRGATADAAAPRKDLPAEPLFTFRSS